MWLTGVVAPRHVGSSQTRARTRVPCIGRQILNHCATREAPHPNLDLVCTLRTCLTVAPGLSFVACLHFNSHVLDLIPGQPQPSHGVYSEIRVPQILEDPCPPFPCGAHPSGPPHKGTGAHTHTHTHTLTHGLPCWGSEGSAYGEGERGEKEVGGSSSTGQG